MRVLSSPILCFVLFACQVGPTSNQLHGHPALPLTYPCDSIPSGEELPLEAHCYKDLDNCSKMEATSRYSRLNGLCNNLDTPTSGAAGTNFRFLDGKRLVVLNTADMSHYVVDTDHKLPNARLVSTVIHGNSENIDDRSLSLLMMQFGQFLDHDITLTPEDDLCGECGEQPVSCCDFLLGERNYTKEEMPPLCWPIPVPDEDPIYASSDQEAPKCLDFKRSLRSRCPNGVQSRQDSRTGEVFNENTHYIDASNVYGSSEKALKALKMGKNGILLGDEGSPILLPEEVDSCSIRVSRLFKAGDARVNENPGLQAMHTIFAREHNRLARLIKSVAIHKSDNDVLMEARKYMIAQMQTIVYQEFLPEILSTDTMVKYDLDVRKPSTYNQTISPTIYNEFSTAAFRFGHTLVQNLFSTDRGSGSKVPLANHFFNTSIVAARRQLGSFAEAMTAQRSARLDSGVASAIRNQLFRMSGAKFGSDLAALNIQRGRDHGQASYDEARRFCGLQPLPKSFLPGNGPAEMSNRTWFQLSRVYSSPLDIDLFPGGLSEKPSSSGRLGPTFACIIGLQFHNLRIGDRYFFTHDNVDDGVMFCPEEIDIVRSRTIRDIICDNTDATELPLKALRVATDPDNPNVMCKDLKNELDPRLLCLFGAKKPTWKLHPPSPTPDYHAFKDEVVVVAGGFDGKSVMVSVEVYSDNSRCNFELSQLPFPNHGLMLQFMKGRLYACGGAVADNATSCYFHEPNINKWIPDQKLELNRPRWLSARAVLPAGVFLSGGWNSGSGLEYIDRFSERWKFADVGGPKLARHCMVALNNDQLIMLGGFGNVYGVKMYDFKTETWTTLNDTSFPADSHSCVLLPKTAHNGQSKILVVGHKAFIYNVSTGRSDIVGQPFYRRDHGAIVTLNMRILVIGGKYDTNIVEEYIPTLQIFSTVSTKILHGRSRFGWTTMPMSYIQGFNYNCSS